MLAVQVVEQPNADVQQSIARTRPAMSKRSPPTLARGLRQAW
jgi:hypothetical protein